MTHRMLEIETPHGDLTGYVRVDADLDGTFKLQELDGEVFTVNGWACDITDLGLVEAPEAVHGGV